MVVEAKSKVEPGEGLFIVYTGNGKGKTTAALGILVRAWGQGMRTCMFQFIKQPEQQNGEHKAAEALGIPIIALGDGCTRGRMDLALGKALALRQWAACKQAIQGGAYDVLVLDEITLAIREGWIEAQEVVGAVLARPAGMHVVITGRYADPALLARADLVTEMGQVKHPYHDRGLTVQRGIDY